MGSTYLLTIALDHIYQHIGEIAHIDKGLIFVHITIGLLKSAQGYKSKMLSLHLL